VRVPNLPARAEFMRLASTATLFTTMACTATRTTAGAGSVLGAAAVVEVRNDRFDDLVIYLIRGGTHTELGVTPGVSRRTFVLRPADLGSSGAVVLGAAKRGVPMEQITAPFDLAPGRTASWAVRAGARTEEPVVR
jgi:hypothetical protein